MPDIKPPLAVLSAQSGTQDAALGTYCWHTEEHGICADAIGLPIPDAGLAVQVGEQLSIKLPGFDQLVNVAIELYDYSYAQVEFGEAMIVYPPPGKIAIGFQNNGPAVTLTADVSPGEYVLSIYLEVPETPFETKTPNATTTTERGGAVYGFHIEVVEAKS